MKSKQQRFVLEKRGKPMRKIKLAEHFKRIYSVISVLSTLTILLGGIYYLWGHLTNNNQSDNDLLMRQIKAEMSDNERMIDMENADIHGFGNNSIIVTTGNAGKVEWREENKNNFIIMDSVQNKILNSMNDFLGLKSSYKTTFSYCIGAQQMHLYPKINRVEDLFGDATKEIVIRYGVWGSTYGAYFPAVFRYSYENESYELAGTYPIAEKADLTQYDDNGDILYSKALVVETPFHQAAANGGDVYTFYDSDGTFHLTTYSETYCRDFWAEFSNIGKMLVAFRYDRDGDESFINCYQPLWRESEHELQWNMIYSEYISEPLEHYTEAELAKWMEEKFHCQVKLY